MCGSTGRCSNYWRESFLFSTGTHRTIGSFNKSRTEPENSTLQPSIKNPLSCSAHSATGVILLSSTLLVEKDWCYAEQDTDEVYAQITLQLLKSDSRVNWSPLLLGPCFTKMYTDHQNIPECCRQPRISLERKVYGLYVLAVTLDSELIYRISIR